MSKGVQCDFSKPEGEVCTPYEEIQVNDEEIKYKKLCESLERQNERLEREIERLTSFIYTPKYITPENNPLNTPNTSTTIPTGVTLKSQAIRNIEDLLQQKAIAKQQKEESK